MIIIPLNPDPVSYKEGQVDESDAKQLVLCHKRDIPDTAGTIESLINDNK